MKFLIVLWLYYSKLFSLSDSRWKTIKYEFNTHGCLCNYLCLLDHLKQSSRVTNTFSEELHVWFLTVIINMQPFCIEFSPLYIPASQLGDIQAELRSPWQQSQHVSLWYQPVPQRSKVYHRALKLALSVCFTLSLTHRHTCWFLWFTGTLHRRNGFYTVQAVCAIALHLPYT